MEEGLMELLLWLEQIVIWRLQREHGFVKEEDPGASHDDALPVASYPQGDTHADHHRYHSAGRQAS
jgi:hypothetical protein